MVVAAELSMKAENAATVDDDGVDDRRVRMKSSNDDDDCTTRDNGTASDIYYLSSKASLSL